MASTSGTYNFLSLKITDIIDEAYERIGLSGSLISGGEDLESARRSLNILLREWANRGYNLWTETEGMIGLIPFINVYSLPDITKKILTATTRKTTRELGGTAFSSAGGNANNAFDGDATTACTQNAPNGYISYDYGNGSQRRIQCVGILTHVRRDYNLIVETSDDNINWLELFSSISQIFTPQQTIWFTILIPRFSRYIRIRERGGATLDISEIYFSTIEQDLIMTEISENDYTSYSNKNVRGKPQNYYFRRVIPPLLNVYPTPDTTEAGTSIYFTYERVLQDVGAMTNNIDIPDRFFEAICAGLALKLAVKKTPDKVPFLKPLYDEAFARAAAEDSQDTPLRIGIDDRMND